MATPYIDARNVLRTAAAEKSEHFARDGETIPITSAVGRVCRDAYHSPASTPSFDSSAMDGFAVNSEATCSASPDKPIIFSVQGTIAAGDPAPSISTCSSDGTTSCVEIMTGAQFPVCSDISLEKFFDACVRVEDTTTITGSGPTSKLIKITKPVRPGQNRRLAGSDFLDKDLIIRPGTTISPNHVMAFAALGIREVIVYRRLRVGVLSTGKELISIDEIDDGVATRLRDSNGPYIEAVLTGLGVEVLNLGIVKDDMSDFTERILTALTHDKLDIIVSTGAVSMGKFDFVAEGLKRMRADMLFHKVAMRPGHPVLFAKLPSQALARQVTPPPSPANDVQKNRTAFFGLPGNPLAAAVCLRFLVILYLRALHGLPIEERCWTATLNSTFGGGPMVKSPSHLQTYHHARYSQEINEVVLSRDQSSNKIKPLLDANCWIEIPAGRDEVRVGSVVKVYEMYPSSLGR